MSSAALAVDLGDMGKVTFDQELVLAVSQLSMTTFCHEEVWDGLDAVTGTANGLVGGGNSGVFVYANTFSDMNLSVQYTKGGSANNADNGNTEGTSDLRLFVNIFNGWSRCWFWLWRNS